MKQFLIRLLLACAARAENVMLITHEFQLSAVQYAALNVMKNDEARFENCRKLVLAEQAKLLDVQLLTQKPATKAVMESQQEVIYETEYEPPGYSPPTEILDGIFPYVGGMYRVPVAFEPRSVGVMLEFSTYFTKKGVDLELYNETVEYPKDKYWAGRKDHLGNFTAYTLPIFYLRKHSFSNLMPYDEPTITGITFPCDAHGKRDTSQIIVHFATVMKTL